MNVRALFASALNAQTTQNPVGAGLLAKAVGQATSMFTVPPSSRASPLPQGFVRVHYCSGTKNGPKAVSY
ncbi:hypothetical protein F7R14_17815 [Pseudomonas lini]|uniref:Uncharacterized protein n=1 Tax=Pseudomonas lini TaxID=163011 RepID=A0A7V7P3E3_9PSED|nr:hypothetical protein F7R14_17815 [Pseudomonas lini]MDT9678357.1 hypothetical protein [Pseudomonas sp. JV414]